MSDRSIETGVSLTDAEATLEPPASMPSWLTGAFLEQHLQNHYNNSKIQVIDHVVEPPKNYGNFASVIYRVNVKFDACAFDDSHSANKVGFN